MTDAFWNNQPNSLGSQGWKGTADSGRATLTPEVLKRAAEHLVSGLGESSHYPYILSVEQANYLEKLWKDAGSVGTLERFITRNMAEIFFMHLQDVSSNQTDQNVKD